MVAEKDTPRDVVKEKWVRYVAAAAAMSAVVA